MTKKNTNNNTLVREQQLKNSSPKKIIDISHCTPTALAKIDKYKSFLKDCPESEHGLFVELIDNMMKYLTYHEKECSDLMREFCFSQLNYWWNSYFTEMKALVCIQPAPTPVTLIQYQVKEHERSYKLKEEAIHTETYKPDGLWMSDVNNKIVSAIYNGCNSILNNDIEIEIHVSEFSYNGLKHINNLIHVHGSDDIGMIPTHMIVHSTTFEGISVSEYIGHLDYPKKAVYHINGSTNASLDIIYSNEVPFGEIILGRKKVDEKNGGVFFAPYVVPMVSHNPLINKLKIMYRMGIATPEESTGMTYFVRGGWIKRET